MTKKGSNLIIFMLMAIFMLVYSIIAIQSHNHYETFGWDLGFFDQLVWQISRLYYPLSTLNYVNFIANHFSPLLMVNSLFYLIWSDVRMLLINQVIIMVLAAFPLYLLSLEMTGSKLFTISVTFSYLLFQGTQWSILNEFHEATYAPFFIVLFFYAANSKKRLNLLIASIIGILFTKEEFSLLLAALSFPLYFVFGQKKHALILFFFSSFFFFFLTEFFMPAISESGVYQHSHIAADAKTPAEYTLKLINNPLLAIQSLFIPFDKVILLLATLGSFAFFPVFAPLSVLVPSIEQFLMRFLYAGPQFTVWQNTNHHAAPVAILFPIAAIFAVSRLGRNYPIYKAKIIYFSALVLFFATIASDIILKNPIHSIVKSSLYDKSDWMRNADKLVNIVPENVPVAAQNSLFPHLSQRNQIYLLPEVHNAKYLAVDMHDGPNKFAPLNLEEMKSLIETLTANGSFKVEAQFGDSILLKKAY